MRFHQQNFHIQFTKTKTRITDIPDHFQDHLHPGQKYLFLFVKHPALDFKFTGQSFHGKLLAKLFNKY